MITFDVRKLKREYLDWYNQTLESSNSSNNVARTDTPFKDNSLDNLIVYALYDQSRDMITLTDDGYTIFDLENNGISLNKPEKRKRIFEEYLSAYGIKYNDKTHEIFVQTNSKNSSKSRHNLSRCLTFVNGMYLLSNPKSQNILTEDVTNKLGEHNIYYGRDLPTIGSSGVVYNSDFFISVRKNQKEKFINATSNPNNSMIIKSKITDATQAKK